MILWGLFSILRPEISNQMSESSMITIDGNGIFLILCVVAVIMAVRYRELIMKIVRKKFKKKKKTEE